MSSCVLGYQNHVLWQHCQRRATGGSAIPKGSCCSVAQLCLTLCDPINCSTPGFPVLHCLPAFAQTPVRGCHPTISSCVTSVSSCPQSFPVSGSFPMNWLFALGGQSIGASASASVLPVNIQIRAAGSPALRIRLPSSEPDRYLSILSSSFPPHKLRPSLGKRGRKDRANLLTDQVKVQKSLCLKP